MKKYRAMVPRKKQTRRALRQSLFIQSRKGTERNDLRWREDKDYSVLQQKEFEWDNFITIFSAMIFRQWHFELLFKFWQRYVSSRGWKHYVCREYARHACNFIGVWQFWELHKPSLPLKSVINQENLVLSKSNSKKYTPHVSGLSPFKGTIQQTTEHAPNPKTTASKMTATTAAYETFYTSENWRLRPIAAVLLQSNPGPRSI